MPINPIQFAHNVCDEFLRYIFSAFPLADPDLAAQAKEMFKRPSSLSIPLVQGPYVSLSKAFAKGDAIADLAARGMLHPVMPGLIGYETMWGHQQRVFEAVRRGEHVLVATGTGSGKTEAFLYPIVDDLLRQRDQGVQAGLAAILVYPMNALANDQLERLRDMLAGTGITFGQWVGTTPDKEKDVFLERFPSSSREAYLAERHKRRKEALDENRGVHPIAPLEECRSEEDIRSRRPRILITNYRQLEILTTRWPDVSLFADAPLKYLVFDEAHTYEGAVGAEVACLIRRVRALAGKTPEQVTCVGTSATLADPGKDKTENEEAARRFASRFFGVDQGKVALIGESYVAREWPRARIRTAPPLGDGMERLNRLLKALAEPVNLPDLKAVIEELTGQMVDLGQDWQGDLFQHLLGNEYVYQATQVLTEPKLLADAAWQTSQRLAPDRLKQGPRADAELLAYLVLGAAARSRGEALLRPKVHFFIRGLDEMTVALDGEPDKVQVHLFMSLAEAREAYPNRREDAFLPVLTCRNCGQHFFERRFQNLELATGTRGDIRDFAGGDALAGQDGQSDAVWPTAPEGVGTRLVTTNRLLEESEGQGGTKSARWPKGYVCRQCGALHRHSASKCSADGCGHEAALLPLLGFGKDLSSCPSCGTLSYRIGGQVIEPARRVRAVTVSDVHILAQAMINSAPTDHKKLIIFADSRQDAAFQAGWMQDHARRIRLRHMMHDAIGNSDGAARLGDIVDHLMGAFRKDRHLIDALLPELTGEEAEARFGHNLMLNVHRALRYMVLREFTTGIRRTDCLEAMGLALVSYEGLSPENEELREWAAIVGISPQEAAHAVSLILDLWRRNRILYVADGEIYSRYHARDDEYIQAGLLPLRDFRPEGLLLQAGENDKYARGIKTSRGQSAVQALIRKWAVDPGRLDIEAAADKLWALLTGPTRLLSKTVLLSQKDTRLSGEVWQVNADAVRVHASSQRERCRTCQRVTTRPAPHSHCTRHHCPGTTMTMEPDKDNYDVWLMRRPFVMVSAEEHTAQVPGETRLRIEQDFKSRKGRTNCLVATPTLEMGVNIGDLDMVLMRNVPPRPSNYWQRAGRAGREEHMAVAVTYCRRSPHDRYFFDDPLRLLGGAIEAPVFNLNNPLMVAKHVRSAVLSELLLRARGKGALAERIRDTLEPCFPLFIRDYLLDEHTHFREAPPNPQALSALLKDLQGELTDRVVHLFARHWPEEAQELASRAMIESTVATTSDALQDVLRRLHRRLAWARKVQQEIHHKKEIGPVEREDRQLLWRCENYIDRIIRRDSTTYTLTVLGAEGFLPGYGVYESGVVASARTGFSHHPGARAFELSRSNVVALREFVPGNRLYANRGTFYVSRFHLGADESSTVRTLRVDADKGLVMDFADNVAYGQSGAQVIDALPIADLDLTHESRITEDESLRFSMPVEIVGRLRSRCRGGRAYKIGVTEAHHLKGQGIELVNLGEAGRVKRKEMGHWICSVCGAAKTPYAVQREIDHFVQVHKERCGREPVRLALTAQADVDMIQFHAMETPTKALNIGEALRMGAARVLDMGPEDLQLLSVHKADDTLDLLLYDPMPGGSGLLDQMIARWPEIIAASRDVLANCPLGCEAACYCCLKTFRNQAHHAALDRHKALEYLDAMAHSPTAYRDIAPRFEEEAASEGSPSNTAEARLARLLGDHHFPAGQSRHRITTTAGMATIPDWLHEPSKTAVYLDGMSRGLHGDPKTAQRDQLIRQMLELDGYKVIVVQSRDLDDPEAMRRHLRNIAVALGRGDLASAE